MPAKKTLIPVNRMADTFSRGIAIGRGTIKELRTFKGADHSHRDDYHLFLFQEKGRISIEIDFQEYNIEASSVIYIHPDQVHRLGTFQNVTLSFWVINNENLHPGTLQLLDDITPSKPLVLEKESFSIIHDAVSLCIKLSERTDGNLHHFLLKESCNTLISIVASQYLAQSKPADKTSRFEMITKAFRAALERDFPLAKRPAEYAGKLNLSVPYLNECVKNATGHSVSHHISERIVLEAKRLLYYSNKSVKEIASELGYDDHAYFSRLFVKVAGISPLTFRSKNLG